MAVDAAVDAIFYQGIGLLWQRITAPLGGNGHRPAKTLFLTLDIDAGNLIAFQRTPDSGAQICDLMGIRCGGQRRKRDNLHAVLVQGRPADHTNARQQKEGDDPTESE